MQDVLPLFARIPIEEGDVDFGGDLEGRGHAKGVVGAAAGEGEPEGCLEVVGELDLLGAVFRGWGGLDDVEQAEDGESLIFLPTECQNRGCDAIRERRESDFFALGFTQSSRSLSKIGFGIYRMRITNVFAFIFHKRQQSPSSSRPFLFSPILGTYPNAAACAERWQTRWRAADTTS